MDKFSVELIIILKVENIKPSVRTIVYIVCFKSVFHREFRRNKNNTLISNHGEILYSISYQI